VDARGGEGGDLREDYTVHISMSREERGEWV
jgi:hypothetical protein